MNTTGAPGFNDAQVAVNAGTILAGAANYSTALPAGSFKLGLTNITGLSAIAPSVAASAVNAVTGASATELIPVTVGGQAVTTYQAEEYQWTITTPAASSVSLSVVQTDATGKPDWGTNKVVASVLGTNGSYYTQDFRATAVVNAVSSVAAGGMTSVQLNTELLPGTYKAYVQAFNASGVPVAATYVSPSTITSTSATAGTTKNVSITLAAGKAVSLVLQNTAGTAVANRWVDFYEGSTWFPLGSIATDATGTASIGVDSTVTTVVAVVNDTTGLGTDAIYTFSGIGAGGATATLKQQTITGVVTPNGSCALTPVNAATTIGTIKVASPTDATLPGIFSNVPLAASSPVSTNGSFSLTLFGPTTGTINYNLSSQGTASPGVDGCPDVAITPVAVGAAAVTQNLTAAGGGTIIGKVSTKSGTAVQNMAIDLWQSTTSGNKLVFSTKTDANGNYQIPVAYGTYTLWVGSSGLAGFAAATGWAATENITVAVGAANITKNLTQYSLTGQVSKSMGGQQQASTSPTINVGGLTAVASSLGVFSVNVMEGKTWFCQKPGATETTYAYRCDLNVQIDAAAVAAAGQ